MDATAVPTQVPMETKGVNINYRPTGDRWLVEITPNPLTMSEAFRPPWRAVFTLPGLPPNQQFTHSQMLSALSMALEEIAQEKVEADQFYR